MGTSSGYTTEGETGLEPTGMKQVTPGMGPIGHEAEPVPGSTRPVFMSMLKYMNITPLCNSYSHLQSVENLIV